MTELPRCTPLNSSPQAGILDLHTPEVRKAELTEAIRRCNGRESNTQTTDHKSDALTTYTIGVLYMIILLRTLKYE